MLLDSKGSDLHAKESGKTSALPSSAKITRNHQAFFSTNRVGAILSRSRV